MAVFMGTFIWYRALILLVPYVVLTALRVARDEDDASRLRNRCWRPVRLALACTLVLFLARQGILFFGTDVTLPAAVVLKGLTGLTPVLIAMLVYHKEPDRLHRFTLAALALCVCADLLINLNTYVGMAIFAAAHILLIMAFLGKPMVSLREWILIATGWVLLSLMAWGFRAWMPGGILVPCILYALTTSAMVVAAFRRQNRVRIGAVLLAMADIMVALKITFPGNQLLDFTELLLYYLGILIVASDGYALVPRNIRPQYIHHQRSQEADALGK